MNIALIAHDKKKAEMIEFVQKYEADLKGHQLFTTGTTGLRIMENTIWALWRRSTNWCLCC